MAQAGARVIKVESRSGETLRARGEAETASFAFSLLNSNKESITLNIKHEQGQALLMSLVRGVDVVLENFAPGTLDKYGIGADRLRAINPRLIYASSTGYGRAEGPYRDYLGMDITLQAMTGVMSITGEEGGPPLKTAAAFADFIAGTHLYAGIVSALYRREQTGEGALVDISMQDCVFPTLATALGSYYVMGGQPPRAGNRHPGLALAPYNVYQASDGHVAIICIREGHWRRLCRAMGRPELMEDPRFATVADRTRHMEVLDETVNAWSRNLTRAEIFATAQAEGVICAPVKSLSDVLEDPHLAARGTLRKRQHPAFGETVQMQTPLRYAEVEPLEPGPPPALGNATDAVLKELAGLDDAAIQALRDAEAI